MVHFGEIAALNRIVQIALIAFTVFADHGFGFGIAQVFNALLGTEMEFHPETLIGRIDEAVRMRAKTVHVAIAFGMPRSDITIVTWCKASGNNVQKSQLYLALRKLVRGSRLTALFKSGNLRGSRKKNTGVLLPTMSPVAFFGVELQGKAADVALGIGCTAFTGHGGETGKHLGFLPIWLKIFARVYWVMSWVTVKVPNAPEPLACMRRSGITSRTKLASFSLSHTSCASKGPRGILSCCLIVHDGAPKLVVRCGDGAFRS